MLIIKLAMIPLSRVLTNICNMYRHCACIIEHFCPVTIFFCSSNASDTDAGTGRSCFNSVQYIWQTESFLNCQFFKGADSLHHFNSENNSSSKQGQWWLTPMFSTLTLWYGRCIAMQNMGQSYVQFWRNNEECRKLVTHRLCGRV